jgi:hypothetical protein
MSTVLECCRGRVCMLQNGGRRSGVAFALAVLAAGCVIARSGPEVGDFRPAHTPYGVHTTLSAWGSMFEGELLEVREEGLLLLATETHREGQGQEQGQGRLILVAFEDMATPIFRDYPVSWRSGTAPEAPARGRLALASRYPVGLSASQLARLLAAHGQDALDRGPRRSPPEADPEGHAHHSDSGVEAFLARTAESLERLRTVEAALAAGYRPLGPDFPGMGRHWVQSSLLVRGPDPAHPPLLTFLDTPAGTILTGAAFGSLLAPGDAEPDFPFAGAWHAHTGTVDEETLKLGSAHTHGDVEGPRLIMLHVWLGLENPEGVFAQDNWAVPWVRAGIPTPASPSPSAGKALFLRSGGDAYYLELIRRSAEPSPEEEAAAVRTLAEARDRVVALTAPGSPSGGDSDHLVAPLEDLWGSMWKDLLPAFSAEKGIKLLAMLGR